jgi:hypothetical protein
VTVESRIRSGIIAGLWSGQEVVDAVRILGEDRAESLVFMLKN